MPAAVAGMIGCGGDGLTERSEHQHGLRSALSRQPEVDMVEQTLSGTEPGRRRRILRRIMIAGLGLLAVLAIYYLGGAIWLSKVDDDPDFGLQSSAPEGGSKSVAVAADLIDREVNTHRWFANDPFFLPGSCSTTCRTSRWASSPRCRASRSSSATRSPAPAARAEIDPDVNTAAGLLDIPGTPGSSTRRASSGRPRAPNPSIAARCARSATTTSGSPRARRCSSPAPTTCRRPSTAWPPTSARRPPRLIARSSRDSGFWPDFGADDLFYANKGRLYAYYLLLRALGSDFDNVIKQRDLGAPWTRMLKASARPRRSSPGSWSTALRPASSCPATWHGRASFCCCARAPGLGKSATSCSNNRPRQLLGATAMSSVA